MTFSCVFSLYLSLFFALISSTMQNFCQSTLNIWKVMEIQNEKPTRNYKRNRMSSSRSRKRQRRNKNGKWKKFGAFLLLVSFTSLQILWCSTYYFAMPSHRIVSYRDSKTKSDFERKKERERKRWKAEWSLPFFFL